MMKLERGSVIGLPCKVNPGPFDDELLVEFDTLDGKVSGFTNRSNIRENGGRQFIRATVKSVSGETVTVMVQGSFFTTNGLANVQSNSIESLPLAA
jgi:transcriptional regulator of nitric oxide reductase